MHQGVPFEVHGTFDHVSILTEVLQIFRNVVLSSFIFTFRVLKVQCVRPHIQGLRSGASVLFELLLVPLIAQS